MRYADSAEIEMQLGSAKNALAKLGQLDYSGGYTNTGDALKFCASTLEGSTNRKLVVLITDGKPTRPSSDPWGHAERSA